MKTPDPLSLLEQGRWIYENLNPQEDEYTSYLAEFDSPLDQDAILLICADSDAICHLNGELAYFGISPAYPDFPIADSVEVRLKKGSNKLEITQYYFGNDASSSYAKGSARLKFVIASKEGEIIIKSDASTLSGPNQSYASHKKKSITCQLGYSYAYDANKAEDRIPFHPSHEIPSFGEIKMRVNKRCSCQTRAEATIQRLGKGHYMIDLGKESVGFLDLDFVSPKAQAIKFAYAEHREGNNLTHLIGGRDFSVDYTAKPGQNTFLGTFRRLGLRYLEVMGEEDLEINYIGIRLVTYPFVRIPRKLTDPELQKIYETAVHTLECCYHDHYEDCPWREQCLYAMDAYNQMLAGFSCFSNTEQIKSSLLLISEDKRDDRLLSITSPSTNRLVIPSFSLFYFFAVEAYFAKMGDLEFLKKVYPKLTDLAKTFFAQEDNGLIYTFTQDGAWNFYEWRDGLSGNLFQNQERKFDIILNGLFLLALEKLEVIEASLGIASDYSSFRKKNKERIRATLLKDGLFAMSEDLPLFSEYGNALAVLAGYAEEKETKIILDQLKRNDSKLVKTTLASRPFVYEALLKEGEGCKDFIIEDIKSTFGKMLADGATSFYETELGWKDFDNAGSLCHGWSAWPIRYFERLKLFEE